MKRLCNVLAIVAVVMLGGRVLAFAEAQERALDPLVLEWDTGADKIDVSKYPVEIRKDYKVFADLCSRCHPLARAINCDFATEVDWERYIKRMMRRAGKMIPPDDAQRVFDFAVYDSKIRKKELYERRMAAIR